MAADAMSGGHKGAFSGEGHRQLGAGGSRKKSRRRELHPRPRFHKSILHILLASNGDASGCTMSALRRHYRSLSPLGMAWHRKSGKKITELVRDSEV